MQGGAQINGVIARNQHRERFRSFGCGKWNHRARFYLRLTVERGLEICGIDLQASGGDDCLLTASAKIYAAVWAKLADVACVNPTLLVGERCAVALPVSSRDVFAANENLAIFA